MRQKDFRTPFDVIMIYAKRSTPLAVDDSEIAACDWLVTEMAIPVRLSSNRSRFSTNEKLGMNSGYYINSADILHAL